MHKTIIILITLAIVGSMIPLSASAITLVPCGRSDQKGSADEQCQFRHLVILIIRLINYLISVAALVAMYYILLSGWNLITSMGNPEKIKTARTGISNAVVGFAIIILGFVFVNLLVNGIFGTGDPEARKWWDAECIYNPGKIGCPFSTSN